MNTITHWHRTRLPDQPSKRNVALRYHNGAISLLIWFWDSGDLVWRAVLDTNACVSDTLVRDWSYVE